MRKSILDDKANFVDEIYVHDVRRIIWVMFLAAWYSFMFFGAWYLLTHVWPQPWQAWMRMPTWEILPIPHWGVIVLGSLAAQIFAIWRR